MQIRLVSTGKKRFLPLLLLADEQESMIDRYLERGDLYVMYDKLFTEPVAVAVVTDEGKGVRELKNLAVAPHWQRKGHPIVEDGKVLKDMYYFSRTLTQTNETDG